MEVPRVEANTGVVPPLEIGSEISEILLSSGTCNFVSFNIFGSDNGFGDISIRPLQIFKPIEKIFKTRKVTGI